MQIKNRLKIQEQKKIGQSIVEFALILGLVCLLGVAVMQSLGESLKSTFKNFTIKLQNANDRSNASL